VFFTVTVDTEEDNWGEFTRARYTVRNIARIPRLHDLFVRRGIRPTYLISYPVATDRYSIDLLGGYAARAQCEIGTHPHPWNTPPVEEERTAFTSFMCHLPPELQARKIATLTETIARSFGRRPTSYRSGRWGFDEQVAENLIRAGYLVDSSISPTWSWTAYEGPDFSHCSWEPFVYRLDGPDGNGRSMLEVPATIDYLQAHRPLATSVSGALRGIPLGDKIAAALGKMGLLNNVSVSPEMNDAVEMERVSRALARRGARVVNMFFHSPTLLEGCTPFVHSPQDADAFLARIDAFLRFAQSAGWEPVTLSELSAEAAGASGVRLIRPSRVAASATA
jgi:hypothetical protein